MYRDTFENGGCISVVKYIYAVSIVSRYFATFWYLVTFLGENEVLCVKMFEILLVEDVTVLTPKSRNKAAS
ncbi:MAG: hypothetical protein PV344_05955, partial [Anaplasma sp.]|nr:hypothetical protein [Anaplasma sp.]